MSAVSTAGGGSRKRHGFVAHQRRRTARSQTECRALRMLRIVFGAFPSRRSRAVSRVMRSSSRRSDGDLAERRIDVDVEVRLDGLAVRRPAKALATKPRLVRNRFGGPPVS